MIQKLHDARPAPPPRDPELRTGAPHRSKFPMIVAVVAVFAVLMSFSYWYSGWFGRPATIEEIKASFASENPRDVQFALQKSYDRFLEPREGGTEDAPAPMSSELMELARLCLKQADAPEPEVRRFAAWALGGARPWAEGRRMLEGLLVDPDANVRRNAALALSKHRSRAGIQILREMLAQANTEESYNALLAFQLIGITEDVPYLQNARSASPSGKETFDDVIERAKLRDHVEPFE